MNQTAYIVESEALKLSKSNRAEIALHLLESLDADETSNRTNTDHEAAWLAESERRLDAYHRGEIKAYPLEEIVKELTE